MSRPATDPLIDLIAGGRVHTRPIQHYGMATVLNVNLDILCNILRARLKDVFKWHQGLRNRYSGNTDTITRNIDADINAMVDFAMLICYNRLRRVAETFSGNIRTTRMNPRAPVSDRMEFPRFVSSLLSSIGPLKISDAANDTFVIYATAASTMQTFGRAAATDPKEGNYSRLVSSMRAEGIAVAPIDVNNLTTGSYWTTIQVSTNNFVNTYVGTVHPSHYENEDIARAFILGPHSLAKNPFDPVLLTVGYVDNTAVLDALAAVPPADPPAGTTPDSEARPQNFNYNVNFYGIKLAVAQQGAVPAIPRGCYILGRGSEPIFAHFLADQIVEFEVNTTLRYRLLEVEATARK